ncbi:hypothetical protein [Dyadobacter sp. NIV53]|uniref:Uncharacterized protein n=1 Tax=Dyadobacter psychrophilus TaxID=651661 RepID=A0A1T5HJN8_9BACT|nr:hypothetical protein [Dyadobacter sp. NIV53]SKC20887.1 hypothetical protein SAMN05660293_05741 [Dyadobacter psychrophilus]
MTVRGDFIYWSSLGYQIDENDLEFILLPILHISTGWGNTPLMLTRILEARVCGH